MPDPKKDRPGSPMPENIALLLHIVRTLIAFGRYFGETLNHRANSRFFILAACAFGTHRLDRIRDHVRRGLRRAIALERFLIARAQKGLEVAPTIHPGGQAEEAALAPASPLGPLQGKPRNPPRSATTSEIRLPSTDPDDSSQFYLPSMTELAKEVRNFPAGRTIDAICMDFGMIFPEFCTKAFYNLLIRAQFDFGGDCNMISHVRARRQESFERECRGGWGGDPACYYWERGPDSARDVFGCLLGEDPPELGRDLYYLDWPAPLEGCPSPFDWVPPAVPTGPPPSAALS